MAKARKGKLIAKQGALELRVTPAEANGWRAEVCKRGKGSYCPSIKSVWRRTRTEAGAVARGMKSRYFK
jgi:hypothetical protein